MFLTLFSQSASSGGGGVRSAPQHHPKTVGNRFVTVASTRKQHTGHPLARMQGWFWSVILYRNIKTGKYLKSEILCFTWLSFFETRVLKRWPF